MKSQSPLGLGFSRFVLGLRCDEGGGRVLTRDRAILGADKLCKNFLKNRPVKVDRQSTDRKPGQPMPNLQLASTKIPPELMERLKRFTELSGVNQSAAIRQAIEQFLDNAESTGLTQLTRSEGNFKPSELMARVDSVDDRLTDIEGRLLAVEGRSAKTEPIAAVVTTENTQGDRIGPKRAFEILQSKGYRRSRATFERRLKESKECGELPPDLVTLGLNADFELARSKNPKDAFDRWLWVK
jgi:Ribbon-helix-helix protein, copG family